MTAERKIHRTVDAPDYAGILAVLEQGWKLDPFFHKTGRPWTVDNGHVWVMVKGTPREIQELDPFVHLPEPQMSPEDQAFVNKWKDVIDVVEIKAESIVDGTVAGLVAQGWEVSNVLKGLVSLVLRDKGETQEPVLEALVLQEDPEPPKCERGVHEPLKADVLTCQGCDYWKTEPEQTPECTWDGWPYFECKHPVACLIERGAEFNAILAMDDCKGCPKYEAFMNTEG